MPTTLIRIKTSLIVLTSDPLTAFFEIIPAAVNEMFPYLRAATKVS